VNQAKELPGSLEVDEGRRIVNQFADRWRQLAYRREEIEKRLEMAQTEVYSAKAILASAAAEDEQAEASGSLHVAQTNVHALEAEKIKLDGEIGSLEAVLRLSWSEPVWSSSGYRLMSAVSASF
jgi:hypothetical protein